VADQAAPRATKCKTQTRATLHGWMPLFTAFSGIWGSHESSTRLAAEPRCPADAGFPAARPANSWCRQIGPFTSHQIVAWMSERAGSWRRSPSSTSRWIPPSPVLLSALRRLPVWPCRHPKLTPPLVLPPATAPAPSPTVGRQDWESLGRGRRAGERRSHTRGDNSEPRRESSSRSSASRETGCRQ
jgi:hypothetical protein